MPAEPAVIATRESLTVRAAAKLNLSLAVLARRPDGYHEIESLMVPVSLHDTLVVRATETPGISLRVRYAGALATADGSVLAGDVPTDGRNLVVRAAEALAAEAGVTQGLDIELAKEIPAGSGLGGGSSDAAAVLMAAARVWGLDWSPAQLAAVGARIGSDVPWFFAGGPAIASGRGEVLDSVADIPPLPAVIVRPTAGLSTAAVYGQCTPDPARRGDAARLATALAHGDGRAATLMHNALEAPARALCPDVDQLLDALARAGAAAPRLTGSGSACFALARTVTEARGIAARLEAQRRPDGSRLWPGVFVVRLCG
ncbi:MAG: 4-diphosphocytidyl-2-C-methyl-D-erythritol kinase [Planctomycetota bacterium]|jgi:4-diphosphocytidyl-2-C-methyl-D-erythritol kinase